MLERRGFVEFPNHVESFLWISKYDAWSFYLNTFGVKSSSLYDLSSNLTSWGTSKIQNLFWLGLVMVSIIGW
jgi:hypothetical protein